MNAFEKIEFLKKAEEDNAKGGYKSPYFLDIGYEENKWQPGEIETIHKQYPWLPAYYIEFLKKYDSLGLTWFRFFGSKETNINPIEEDLKDRKDQMRDVYFPFGDSVGGEYFVFNHQGEVLMFEEEDYEWEEPKKIADSLEEFIGECLLGNRFGEFMDAETSRCCKFLKAQGWCK